MTKDDLEVLEQRYNAGETTYQIAEDYGVKGPTIAYWLVKAGVKLRPRGVVCGMHLKERDAEIAKLLRRGVRTKEIAKELRVSTATIAEVRKAKGLSRRYKRQILSKRQRAAVARRYKAGATYAELRDAFRGVSSGVIRAALEEHEVSPRVGWVKYRACKWTDSRDRTFVFKSSWELRYAEHLEEQGALWDYESKSFPLEKALRYTPDFEVQTSEGPVYVEVHGWLDEPTRKRMMEFRELYPEVAFDLLGPAEMADLGLIEGHYRTHREARRMSDLRFQFTQKTLNT